MSIQSWLQRLLLLLFSVALLPLACSDDDDDSGWVDDDDDVTVDDDDDDDDDIVPPPTDFAYERGGPLMPLPMMRLLLQVGNFQDGFDRFALQAAGFREFGDQQIPILRLYDLATGLAGGLDLVATITEDAFLFGGLALDEGLAGFGIALYPEEPVVMDWGAPEGEPQQVEVDGELTLGDPEYDPSLYAPLAFDYEIEDADATAPSPMGYVTGCTETNFSGGPSSLGFKTGRIAQAADALIQLEGTLWGRPDLGFVHGEVNVQPWGAVEAGLAGRTGFESQGDRAHLYAEGVINDCSDYFSLSTSEIPGVPSADGGRSATLSLEARWADAERALTETPLPVSIQIFVESQNDSPTLTLDTEGVLYPEEWDGETKFWTLETDLSDLAPEGAGPVAYRVEARFDQPLPPNAGPVRIGMVLDYHLVEEAPDFGGLAPLLPDPIATDGHCIRCGDEISEEGEECDGEVNEPCEVPGSPLEGSRSCLSDCSGWTDCFVGAYCGDRTVDPEEACDGQREVSCETEEGYAGIQACLPDCSGYGDCASDEFCGDGLTNGPEECDDHNETDGDGCLECLINGPCGMSVDDEVEFENLGAGNANRVELFTDEGSVRIPIGFDFSYFGTQRDSIVVDVNGTLAFEDWMTGMPYNTPIPQPDAFLAGVLAPFWDDLSVDTDFCSRFGGDACEIWAGYFNTEPNRTLIISWEEARFSESSPDTGYYGAHVSFQVLLFENDNHIEFRYGPLQRGDVKENPHWGEFATIGIESEDGRGFAYSHNTPAVFEGRRVRFDTVGCRCDLPDQPACFVDQ